MSGNWMEDDEAMNKFLLKIGIGIIVVIGIIIFAVVKSCALESKKVGVRATIDYMYANKDKFKSVTKNVWNSGRTNYIITMKSPEELEKIELQDLRDRIKLLEDQLENFMNIDVDSLSGEALHRKFRKMFK